MNCVGEHRLNDMQGENALVKDTKKAMVKNKGRIKLNNDGSKSSITELFPWIVEFRKLCRCMHTEKSMSSLTELMQFYVRNVSVSVNECYTKPLRAAKLKESIRETLLLFLYIYREFSEDRDRSVYLNNMSDLLALYIDMELKASKKSKEDHEKICGRLTSCLYVYLEHSIEHLLDTLIKIQFMCHTYHHILDPVITKIMKNIPARPESSVMYVRYFLVYRLWRKINENPAVKTQITATALASLGTLPSSFSSDVLADVLPKVPNGQACFTKILLHHKFDIKKHCEMFVHRCRKINGTVCLKDGPSTPVDSSSRVIQKMPEDTTSKNAGNLDNKTNLIVSGSKSIQNESISLSKSLKPENLDGKNVSKCLETTSPSNVSARRAGSKLTRLNRNSSRRKCKNSNDIMIIDLTSDVVLEKCIKKRKSRKMSWLEEAKKRLDIKMASAARKIARAEQKNAAGTCQSNNSKIIDHSEDASRSEPATEDISVKCPSDAFQAGNKMDIAEEEAVDRAESTKTSTGTEINSKEASIKASIGKSVLTEIPPSEKQQISNTPDSAVNDKCLHNEDAPEREGKENNAFNKQTVIKRLIEDDAFAEAELCREIRSFDEACGLETEYATVNSSIACTRYDSKDNAVNVNCPNVYATHNEIMERAASSDMNEVLAQDSENVSGDAALNNVCSIETILRSDSCIDTVDPDVNCQKLDAEETGDESRAILNKVMTTVEGSPVRNTTEQTGEQQLSPASAEKSTIEKPESPIESKPLKCNNAATEKLKNYFVGEAELEICNTLVINENLGKNQAPVADTRESIFESYSAEDENISDTVNALCPAENIGKNENSVGDEIKKYENNCQRYVSQKDVTSKCNQTSLGSSEKESREEPNNLCRTQNEKYVRNVLEKKFIVQDAELQDNIDGLSLLASVSQHVPHLKPDTGATYDQIKVKDYASLRYARYNQTTDDEADTNDSSNTVSRLLENPSIEIINRIVGVYPNDTLDKLALRVRVTPSIVAGNDDEGNELRDGVSHQEACINYDVDALSHSLSNLSPVESNAPTTKENTNVILNGETVVLLQKSPNSNLYIINKAVENAKDHNSDDENVRLKEKNWGSLAEECVGQFEAVASLDHATYNMELTSYSKDLPYPEEKCLVLGGKGIKVEPESNNFSEAKGYPKKVPLSSDMMCVNAQMYQDVNAVGMSMDKRKSSKSSLIYRQNIKQEFNNISNRIPPNYAIQGCSGITSLPHEVDTQHPMHIPATHPTTLPSIYGNCAGNTDLCVPYHKHCTSVSCNLQMNGNTSLHGKAATSPCGRSHCTCINCTYDIVAHCRQCIYPPTDTHVSCIESSPYFLPTHSSVQSPAVQEHDRGKNNAVIGKLYDDQLLCKVEKGISENNPLEKLDAHRNTEKMYNKDDENKLPLKKRLKAHALAYRDTSIKTERMSNYPAVPMMSIAALEVLDNAQKRSRQIVRSEYELSPGKKNEDGFHYGTSLVRRDYYKDVHLAGPHQSVSKEGARKVERQFRSANDQANNMLYQEAFPHRPVKTAAQRKEINMSAGTSLTCFEMEQAEQEVLYKKAKKSQSPQRQTRSSKRNVPKVNYSYDVDPEWNPSGESKRKRRKTSR